MGDTACALRPSDQPLVAPLSVPLVLSAYSFGPRPDAQYLGPLVCGKPQAASSNRWVPKWVNRVQ